MHVHCNHSSDAISKPETIMQTAKSKGLVVAITDHNTVSAWPLFQKLSKEMSWPFIQGEEVKVIESGKCTGEIIGLFMQGKVKPGSAGEVFDAIHGQGGLAMVVHPFDVFRNDFHGLKDFVKRIDLLEVFNSRTTLESHNKKAFEFAEKHGLPKTANSDAHIPEEIGMSFTEVNASTLEEARRELLMGRAKLHTEKSPITVHFYTTLAKLNLVKDR